MCLCVSLLILDVGCGNLPQHTYRSNIGIDVVKRPTRRPEIFICGDAYHLPFKTNTFDAITFHQVIEHLDNPKAVLKEILRVLKSHGKLFLATHNIYHWRKFLMILRGRDPHDGTLDHIGCWTHWEMSNLLREVGFSDVNVQTSTFGYGYHTFLDKIARLLLNRKLSDLHLYAVAKKLGR